MSVRITVTEVNHFNITYLLLRPAPSGSLPVWSDSYILLGSGIRSHLLGNISSFLIKICIQPFVKQ